MNIKHILLLTMIAGALTPSVHAAQSETKTQTATRWGKGLSLGIAGAGATAASFMGVALTGYGIIKKDCAILFGLSLAGGMPMLAGKAFKKCSEQFTDAEKKTVFTGATAATTITSAICAVACFGDLLITPPTDASSGIVGALSTALAVWSGKKTYDILKKAQLKPIKN